MPFEQDRSGNRAQRAGGGFRPETFRGETFRTADAGDGHLESEPLKPLLSEFMQEARRLMRAEVDLARTEMREEGRKVARGAAFGGAGAVVLHVALFCLAATCIAALALAMPVWAAALVTCALFAIVGGVLLAAGRNKLRTVAPVRLRNELREDARWLQETTHAVKASRHATA